MSAGVRTIINFHLKLVNSQVLMRKTHQRMLAVLKCKKGKHFIDILKYMHIFF